MLRWCNDARCCPNLLTEERKCFIASLPFLHLSVVHLISSLGEPVQACRVAKCARREHGNTWRLPPSFKLISLQMLNVATSHLPPCNASQFLEIQKLRKGRGGHIRPKLSWRSGAIARNTLLRTVSAWILTDIFSKPMRNMRSLEKPQHPINGYYESILLFHALPALFHDSAWDNHHPRF